MSALFKNSLKPKLPPMPPLNLGGHGKRSQLRKKDYTPVSWEKYFDCVEDVKVGEDIFRIYLCGQDGPVVLLLHGGGHSALSWAVFSATISKLVDCRIAALDLRGHGETVTIDEIDLSADVLSSDVGHVIEALYGDDPPPIIMVGHSMGGAIAVHAAHRKLIPSLIGLAVIDVVEGTAMDALQSMQSFLRGRPASFRSIEHAIEWCVRSGQVRNLESAKVSMVGQIKRVDIGVNTSKESLHNEINCDIKVNNSISEEEEEEEEEERSSPKKSKSEESFNIDTEFKPPLEMPSAKYTWRIDLSQTEKYWPGWFQGLSQMFLDCEMPKMLLLAGVDRLDKELTIGQMQGKFQMQVLPQCGHAVHEDVPDKVADILATFLVRLKVAEPTANFQRTFPAC